MSLTRNLLRLVVICHRGSARHPDRTSESLQSVVKGLLEFRIIHCGCAMSWASGLSVGKPFMECQKGASQQRRCGRPTYMQQRASWIGDFSTGNSLQHQPIQISSGRCRGHRMVTRMGKGKDGPFTPIVVLVRDQLGTKEFNQLRGKAISLHSQVIKDFGKNIGAEAKQVQGIIRLAKQNGEKLGFLS